MTALLYFITAGAAARLARLRSLAAVLLVLLPLAFTGRALLTGRVYAPIDLPYGSEPLSWLKREYGVGRLHHGMLSDVYCLNTPWKYTVRAAYADGELPLCNPALYGTDLLENTRALGRAFVPRHVHRGNKPAIALAQMAKASDFCRARSSPAHG